MRFSDFNLKKNSDGLLPAIVQDARTLKVLMLGYMNEKAFERTLAEGRVTFWSRSRNALWTKGETSGNYLAVCEIYPDCDNDTVLIKAIPSGPVCHRGTTACFDTSENEGFIRTLAEVIRTRHERMPDDSYTTGLFIKGVKAISKKVGEECSEMIIEAASGNRERLVYESCDFIYHFLVLLEQMDVSISELESELARRHPQSGERCK